MRVLSVVSALILILPWTIDHISLNRPDLRGACEPQTAAQSQTENVTEIQITNTKHAIATFSPGLLCRVTNRGAGDARNVTVRFVGRAKNDPRRTWAWSFGEIRGRGGERSFALIDVRDDAVRDKDGLEVIQPNGETEDGQSKVAWGQDLYVVRGF